MRFAEFTAKYLEVKKPQLSPVTYTFYEQVIREMLIPMFGTLRLCDIRTYHIQQFIQYLEEDNRPQVSLDVDFENGMGISVGRLREDSVYDWKFVGLSHNTVRGAAGGAVLCAELLKAKGYITKK